MALIIKQCKSNFKTGIGTVGTSAQLLVEAPFEALKGIYIKCTAGIIYVGTASSVTAATGYPLVAAGDNVVEIAVDSPNKIWIIGDAGGRTYKWLAS